MNARRPRLGRREQLVDVQAVAGLGRHAPRRRVRMRQQPEPLELRELVPDGRGRHAEPGALDQRLRPDGLARRHVLLDDAAEDVSAGALAGRLCIALMVGAVPEMSRGGQASRRAVTPPPRKRPRWVSASVPSARTTRARAAEPLHLARVERPLEAGERQRLVEAQAEHHPLRRAHAPSTAPRAPAAGGSPRLERGEVARERRRVPPAPILDRADGAHPEPEVVVPEPVAEVVPRPEIAAAGLGAGRSSPSRTSGSRPPVSVSTTRSKYDSIASAWRSSSSPWACVKRVPGFASSSYAETCSGSSASASARSRRARRRSGPGCRRSDRARCCRFPHHEERGTARRTSSGEAARPSVRAAAARRSARRARRVDAAAPQQAASSGVTVSGFASTVSSSRARQRVEKPLERAPAA